MKENTITLRDGRKLGYAEYGNANGPIIIFFHGSPGARNHPIALAIEGVAPFARLIMVERPGYGLSDPKEDRTLDDWNCDMEELVAQLNISEFFLAAASGGAPFAYSTCVSMPKRVKKAAIVCGVGPLAVEGLLVEMGESEKEWILATLHAPELIKKNVATIHANPEAYVQGIFNNLPEENRKMVAPAVLEAFKNLAYESSRSPFGLIDDGRTFLSDWKLSFDNIEVPIQFWHGDQDRNVPITHSEFVSSRISNSILHRLEGIDHLTATIAAVPDMLEFLLSK